ncbi:phosphoadenosine phosphosulfate reductase family protein [Acinetobacter beijerinckii]|uniref:phosphoadenosine phosphosulfate reductase family protein n=1 Tax=Acinetobacter beijerinckii TaxID=262668 RepID=UPI0023DE0300|nr:phosphoadenosine phosphosulfate reductase family protein [Acinetobacter beijerinckii]MDF2417274.1 phosphoadenosine phosphosulfate reductase family protein [Acinetobacter beijerinckii]
MKHNIISISGGKDSTATLLLAMAWGVENLKAVFADTGHEHPATYEYLEYLEITLGIQIQKVKADFSFAIQNKREYVTTKWREKGVPESTIENALSVLIPTGNPFLDLCLWKSRFPSTKARFCTSELKVKPIQQLFYPILDDGHMILSWQGVRADESIERRYLPECNEVVQGLYNYRPILRWSAKDVFQAHFDMGIKPNPLYKQGMGRVGCMPCINCNKDELKEIAKRFPEEIERVAEWERIVALVSKRQSATFFTSDYRGHGIHELVEWSKTVRGGKQYDLMEHMSGLEICSSAYGLCE